MRRAVLSLVLLTFTAAVAGGVLHLVAVDERGELTFEPLLDTTALSWWRTRANRVLEDLPSVELGAVTDAR
mgnify:FL=1